MGKDEEDNNKSGMASYPLHPFLILYILLEYNFNCRTVAEAIPA
jgi:hypothetical protein